MSLVLHSNCVILNFFCDPEINCWCPIPSLINRVGGRGGLSIMTPCNQRNIKGCFLKRTKVDNPFNTLGEQVKLMQKTTTFFQSVFKLVNIDLIFFFYIF